MKYYSSISCPVSGEQVNEQVVRIVAAFTVVIASVAFWYHSWVGFLLLASDFAIRAFRLFNGLSILRLAGLQLNVLLQLGYKGIPAKPKRFAAFAGFLFSMGIGLCLLAQMETTALVLFMLLQVCALLEALLAFCVGCVVYSWLIRPFTKK